MASLKALRGRINSVKSTRKITSAMKMVAASKLKRAQTQAEAARPYAERMQRMLAALARSAKGSPTAPRMLVGTGQDKVQLLVVVTADRGLAGGVQHERRPGGAECDPAARGRGQDRQGDHGGPQGPRLPQARVCEPVGRRVQLRGQEAGRVRGRQRGGREGHADARGGRVRRLHDHLQPVRLGDQPGPDREPDDPAGDGRGGRCGAGG